MKFIDRLNQQLGASIRDRVLRDIAEGNAVGPGPVRSSARRIAYLIMATPYLMLGLAGLFFAYATVNLVFGVYGLLALAVALYLRPRKNRYAHPTLSRSEAPELMALLDKLALIMDTPRVDGVQVFGAFNAFAVQEKDGRRILGIGAPLWLAMDPDERLGLLSHEIAHFANNDPARSQVTGRALHLIDSWLELFTPPAMVYRGTNYGYHTEDRGLIALALSAVFGWLFSGLAYGYEKLIFADSQRAEYLADIMAAAVASAPAIQSGLRKTALAPLVERYISSTHYTGRAHLDLFQGMADAVRHPDPQDAARYIDEMMQALHSVDDSHPPTRFRIDILDHLDLGTASIPADAINWDAIDAELADAFHREEQQILSQIVVQ